MDAGTAHTFYTLEQNQNIKGLQGFVNQPRSHENKQQLISNITSNEVFTTLQYQTCLSHPESLEFIQYQLDIKMIIVHLKRYIHQNILKEIGVITEHYETDDKHFICQTS